MKRFLLTTALVLTTAGAAFAQDNSQIRAQVDDALTGLGITVDVNTLTDAQLSEIFLLTNSADSGNKARVEAALSDMMGPMASMEASSSQLRTSVQNSLDRMGIEGDVSTLSNSDVTKLYLMLNSAEMGTATESQIQETFATMQPGSSDAEADAMLVINMPESQLRTSVGNRLQTMGLDIDVNTLSQAQLGEIHLLTTSAMDSNVAAEIEAIVN